MLENTSLPLSGARRHPTGGKCLVKRLSGQTGENEV